MRFLKKIRKNTLDDSDVGSLSKKTDTSLVIIFAEIIIVILIYFLIGFFLNKNDVFSINSKFSPLTLLSLFIGLYYGALAGLSLIFLVFCLSFFLYKNIDYTYFLWNVAIILIANEFKYHWQKKINLAYIELYTTKEALERLRKNFFLLNLSHKELENYYVRRNYSLRDMMSSLRQKAYDTQDINILFEFLLDVLYHNFALREACILRVSEDKSIDILASNTDFSNVEKDKLFVKALEEKSSLYVPITSLSESTDTNMLAVISYQKTSKSYFLCIKDIAFTYLQEEVMDYMRILLGYTAESAEFIETAPKLIKRIVCSIDFTKELLYSRNLYEEYNIESYIIIFKSNKDKTDYIQGKIRGSDVYCIEKNNGIYYFYILLYFATRTGADKFLERLAFEKNELELEGIYLVNEYSL